MKSKDLLTSLSSSASLDSQSLEGFVESYLRYYASGRSHTARAKALDLGHFLSFLASYRGYGTPAKLKVSDWDFSSVQRFLEERLEMGEAPATVARRLATIKHMGRTIGDQMPGFVNPAKDARPPKIGQTKPKAISKSERKEIRKKAQTRVNEKSSFNRLRNTLLFELLIDTGLRADEVRLLTREQLDNDFEWIRNVRTKGRQFINVYINENLREKIKVYLALREEKLLKVIAKLPWSTDKKLPLFISTYGAVPGKADSFRMGAKSIWRAVHELSTTTELHPHLLRHSFALDLLEESNDVRLVAQALGHSDVRITMRYTERRDEDVATAIERVKKKK